MNRLMVIQRFSLAGPHRNLHLLSSRAGRHISTTPTSFNAKKKDGSSVGNGIVEALKELTIQLEGVNNRLDKLGDISKYLAELTKEFKGYQGNESKCNEIEVGRAIYSYLGGEDCCYLPQFGVHLYANKNSSTKNAGAAAGLKKRHSVAEIDVLIKLDENTFAIGEVKRTARFKSMDQLEKNAELFRALEGRPDCRILKFLGGPLFDGKLKREACRRGINVVEVSGDRYKVTEANPDMKENDHDSFTSDTG
jgi:hypothetical protein